MKINAVQLNTRYQVPFRSNTSNDTTVPVQKDNTQFKRNLNGVMVKTTAEAGQARSLNKVLNFFKPRAAAENRKQYTNKEVNDLINERMSYL